ncbi:hypothetical protein [Ktedonobacter sp. SOSP1-52]|uniref:hypothetical protein n=1 Tax=Ktedonobacter sp. SOSP1-52 TaxID=2778366 RepID=UPI0019159ABB|nr:hypothetical protein [Ktedonobacter sp. SOSP1-52]
MAEKTIPNTGVINVMMIAPHMAKAPKYCQYGIGKKKEKRHNVRTQTSQADHSQDKARKSCIASKIYI